ncbi:MAG: ABC transporter ATP-binding protein [Opitutaceae bacterium]
MDSPIIETKGLTKRFGNVVALDRVDLAVQPGRIGLLGPNGAGKTTLIKCLLQLENITEGSARLLGFEVGSDGREARTRAGYAPEIDCHIPGMAGCEYVTYCAQLSGLPFADARQRAHEMLDFVGMGQERYRQIDSYSTGMRQRVKLAQAIVHDPQLLFLDEPTNGLDPKGQEKMLELIHELGTRHGMSIVFSSHLLHEVEQVCEQIIIIGKGRVLVHDALQKLREQREGAAEISLAGRQEETLAAFRARDWPCQTLINGNLRVEHHSDSLNPILEVLREIGVTPIEMIPSPNALQEHFIEALKTAGS